MTGPGSTSSCPSWCARRHGAQLGEEDLVHTSGSLRVRSTLLRLCASTDPVTGVLDGPYVSIRPGGRAADAADPADEHEYTLHEAEALLGALTQLVDQGWDGTLTARQPAADLSPGGAV